MKMSSLHLWVGAIFLFASSAYAKQASDFIQTHGLASENKSTNRATEIFSELARISGRDLFGTELVIVSDQKPWAQAVEDRHVVMSDGAVAFIYGMPNRALSDAWMAFLLGHELAHLSNADLWHRTQQARRSATSDPTLNPVYEGLFDNGMDIKQIQDKELKADFDGFFYATLAGYNTGLLFEPVEDGKTLLEIWPDYTTSEVTHRSADVRMQFLREEFAAVKKDVAFFESGLKLAHFGRYEDALLMFRKFQVQYPSPAVMSNLAYIYIQLARKNMPAHLAYRYWFPTLLEMDSGIPTYALPRTYGDRVSPTATKYLENAVYLLTRSPRIDKRLPEYLNLIVAHWYLGEIAMVRAIVAEALRHYPRNEQLIALGALALLHEGTAEVSTLSQSKAVLESLIANGNTDKNIRFNLARVLSDRKRHGDAKKHWAYLVAHADSVASPFLAIACVELNGDKDCVGGRNPPSSIRTLVRIGSDVGEGKTKKILTDWTRHHASVKGVQFDLYQHHSGDSLLAVDNLVEIYTSKTPPWQTRSRLLAVAGLPDNVTSVVGGTLLSYTDAWSALLSGNSVTELWVSRPVPP
jgi:tetratricopeptide (TPR) repeat protein